MTTLVFSLCSESVQQIADTAVAGSEIRIKEHQQLDIQQYCNKVVSMVVEKRMNDS
jgi:hypothetical protein